MTMPNNPEPSGQDDGAKPETNALYDTLFATVSPQEQTAADTPTRGRSMAEVLNDPAPEPEAEQPPEKEPEAKPEPKPAAEAPKVTRRRKADPLPPIEEQKPAPVAAPVAAAPKEEPKELKLLDEEQDMLDLAKYAENVDAKYKGYAGKLEKFYRQHAEYIDKKRAEDPEFDFTEDNPEYQTWLRANRPPPIPAYDVRKIERERIRQEVAKEADTKVATVREEMRRKEAEPQIQESAKRFMVDVFKDAMPPEAAALAKEQGIEAAKKEFAMEYNIASQVAKSASDMIAEFHRLTGGFKKFNPDKSTEEGRVHASIIDWIDQECTSFATNGGQYRIRDGKQFVPRSQFASLSPEAKAKAWTFSNSDLVEIARHTVKRAVNQQVEQQRKQLESMGFVRQQQARKAPAKPEPKPTPAQVRAAPAPGAAPAAPEQSGGNPVLSVLGF